MIALGEIVKRLRALWQQLRRQGAGHWVTVLILAVFGLYAGRWLGSEQVWIKVRYEIYQASQNFVPHRPYPKNTVLVLIGDEEYWKGELARRVPIRRDYLAHIVRALASANPAVIALDFDMRSPMPDGSMINHRDYEKETWALAEAIKDASRITKIVIPATIGKNNGAYILESDIFAGYDFARERVRKGYIALPNDLRQVPLQLKLKDGKETDSFSEAIVRSFNEEVLKRLPKYDSLPYGSYIPRGEFQVVKAGELLRPGAVDLQKLAHKAVLVSGAWSRSAYGRGGEIDTYPTPVGQIPAVFIHANYVEAILDSRTYYAFGPRIEIGLEILAVVVIAVLFALELKASTKLKWIGGLLGGLLLLSYFLWQNLGRFFDFFVPIILLSCHFALEQIRNWRAKAAAYDQSRARDIQ